MIFTRHAYERYRQFHMLDQPTATDEDARVILDAHSSHAIRLPARTHRGDEVWAIQGLGVELVVKRDGDFEEPVCVTILPPARFRGLTPLLAEQVEESVRRAAERLTQAEQRLEAAKNATAERQKLAEQAAQAKREKDKPGTSAATPPPRLQHTRRLLLESRPWSKLSRPTRSGSRGQRTRSASRAMSATSSWKPSGRCVCS